MSDNDIATILKIGSKKDRNVLRDPQGITAYKYMNALRRVFPGPPEAKVVGQRPKNSSAEVLIHEEIFYKVVSTGTKKKYYDDEGVLIEVSGRPAFQSTSFAAAYYLQWKIHGAHPPKHPTRNYSYEELRKMARDEKVEKHLPEQVPLPTPQEGRARQKAQVVLVGKPLPSPADGRIARNLRSSINDHFSEQQIVCEEFKVGPFQEITDNAVDIVRATLAEFQWDCVRDGDYVKVCPLE